LDRTFAALYAKAIERGELAKAADPKTLAAITTATIHSLAIRARARAPARELSELIDAAVAMICGPEPAKRQPRTAAS
jgi:hypothetical protein